MNIGKICNTFIISLSAQIMETFNHKEREGGGGGEGVGGVLRGGFVDEGD